jgi:anti-anti-sigma regulatory factor
MFKITRVSNGEVIFKLSGQLGGESIGELEALISAETSDRRIVLDLKDLRLVDQDIVSFLKRREADGIQLKNCPPYIREWIKRNKANVSSSSS